MKQNSLFSVILLNKSQYSNLWTPNWLDIENIIILLLASDRVILREESVLPIVADIPIY